MYIYSYISEWEALGGYYWVVQQQILHQMMISEFNDNLLRLFPEKDTYVNFMTNRIENMILDKDFENISHDILLLKISELKDTLLALLDNLRKSANPKVCISNINNIHLKFVIRYNIYSYYYNSVSALLQINTNTNTNASHILYYILLYIETVR